MYTGASVKLVALPTSSASWTARSPPWESQSV